MPKEKEFKKCLPKIYKRNAEDIALLFFVKGQKQIVPTITLDQSIRNFFRLADIDDWDFECAKTTYMRLQNDFFEK